MFSQQHALGRFLPAFYECGVPIMYEMGLLSLITGTCPQVSQRFEFGIVWEKPDKIMTEKSAGVSNHEAQALMYQ